MARAQQMSHSRTCVPSKRAPAGGQLQTVRTLLSGKVDLVALVRRGSISSDPEANHDPNKPGNGQQPRKKDDSESVFGAAARCSGLAPKLEVTVFHCPQSLASCQVGFLR